MWQLRQHLGDPRLHGFGVLVLVVLFLSGILAGRGSAPCPACPGHVEPAGDCLCYHAPTTPESLRR